MPPAQFGLVLLIAFAGAAAWVWSRRRRHAKKSVTTILPLPTSPEIPGETTVGLQPERPSTASNNSLELMLPPHIPEPTFSSSTPPLLVGGAQKQSQEALQLDSQVETLPPSEKEAARPDVPTRVRVPGEPTGQPTITSAPMQAENVIQTVPLALPREASSSPTVREQSYIASTNTPQTPTTTPMREKERGDRRSTLGISEGNTARDPIQILDAHENVATSDRDLPVLPLGVETIPAGVPTKLKEESGLTILALPTESSDGTVSNIAQTFQAHEQSRGAGQVNAITCTVADQMPKSLAVSPGETERLEAGDATQTPMVPFKNGDQKTVGTVEAVETETDNGTGKEGAAARYRAPVLVPGKVRRTKTPTPDGGSAVGKKHWNCEYAVSAIVTDSADSNWLHGDRMEGRLRWRHRKGAGR